MSADGEIFQAAWINSLKSKTPITSLLTNGGQNEIRETQYQGTDFTYPAVRVHLDFMPSINRCGVDDADVYIDVFSAEKSSKEAAHIAATIQNEYHGRTMSYLTHLFPTIIVRKVEKPERGIYGWISRIHIFCQGT